MIIDMLSYAARYRTLCPGFSRAFDFLLQKDLHTFACGTYPIDGKRVYASIAAVKGKGARNAPLEAHRRYIDIQMPLEGEDLIGCAALDRCRRPRDAFDTARDIGFFSGAPAYWVRLVPGQFAVFFPQDAHAPLAGRGNVRKVVVKVRC